MALTVFLAAGPDPGHAFPVLGLAVALQQRGHHVVVGTGPDHRSDMDRAGLDFLQLPLLAASDRDDDVGYRLWGRPAEMAPALAVLLEQRLPGLDVVVSDTLTRAGAWAADLLGVPWIELVPHHLAVPSDDLPPIGLGRRPSSLVPGRRWDDARIRSRQRESIEQGRQLARRSRASIGLSTDDAPLATFVCAVPALEPARSDWPERTHLVGAVAWDPPWPPLEPPRGRQPLVLVTDSTASTVDRSLGEVALDGLRHAGVRLVVTTARTDLRPWPTGCVLGRGPHGPLLEQAAVAVTPGGGGFVAKALSVGVPLVVCPIQGDQRETAGRIVHARLGRRVPASRMTAGRLRRAVIRILADDRFRRRARAAARTSEALGANYAAELLERYVTPSG